MKTKSTRAYFMFGCPPDKETFVFELNEPTRIQEARDILNGKEKHRTHVSGLVVKMPASYNPPWSYHLESSSISLLQCGDGSLRRQHKIRRRTSGGGRRLTAAKQLLVPLMLNPSQGSGRVRRGRTLRGIGAAAKVAQRV